jgi:hypothetical protein
MALVATEPSKTVILPKLEPYSQAAVGVQLGYLAFSARDYGPISFLIGLNRERRRKHEPAAVSIPQTRCSSKCDKPPANADINILVCLRRRLVAVVKSTTVTALSVPSTCHGCAVRLKIP